MTLLTLKNESLETLPLMDKVRNTPASSSTVLPFCFCVYVLHLSLSLSLTSLSLSLRHSGKKCSKPADHIVICFEYIFPLLSGFKCVLDRKCCLIDFPQAVAFRIPALHFPIISCTFNLLFKISQPNLPLETEIDI